MLPDILMPFKHYNEETISGVLDGIVTPEDEDSETCPSEDTMIRWHHWFIINEFNIEGHMKSIGYRLLGFSEELLETGIFHRYGLSVLEFRMTCGKFHQQPCG